MTATEPRTAPTWLDLDAIVPPEVRAEVAEVARLVRSIEGQVAEIAERAHHVLSAVDLAAAHAVGALDEHGLITKGDQDTVVEGIGTVVRAAAGAGALWEALDDLGSHAVVVTGTDPTGTRPAWYERLHPETNGHTG